MDQNTGYKVNCYIVFNEDQVGLNQRNVVGVVGGKETQAQTRSSWLNCALRGDEAVYWGIKGQQQFVCGGTESVKDGTS